MHSVHYTMTWGGKAAWYDIIYCLANNFAKNYILLHYFGKQHKEQEAALSVVNILMRCKTKWDKCSDCDATSPV